MEPLIDPVLVANGLGIADPTEAETGRILDEVLAAQADIEGYLNRPLVGFEVQRVGMWKDPRYPVDQFRAWPWATDEYDDDITVRAATANASGDGTWDVTLYVGLDGAQDPQVIRYIKAHVREVLTHDASFKRLARGISSVSAEGQSISYDKGSTDKNAAGAPPRLESMVRLRRYSAHRAPTRTAI